MTQAIAGLDIFGALTYEK
jgi:DNA polymerase alpha subunit B